MHSRLLQGKSGKEEDGGRVPHYVGVRSLALLTCHGVEGASMA